MSSLERLEDVAYSVTEHTRAIREFKYEMSMKYSNATNTDKKNRIVQKVRDIEQVMLLVHNAFVEDYNNLNSLGADAQLLEKLNKAILEFHAEILSLK